MRVAFLFAVEDALLVQSVDPHTAAGMGDGQIAFGTARKDDPDVRDAAFRVIEEGKVAGFGKVQQVHSIAFFGLL